MWKWLKCLFLGHDYNFYKSVYTPPVKHLKADVDSDEQMVMRLLSGYTQMYHICSKCQKEKVTIRNGDWRNNV